MSPNAIYIAKLFAGLVVLAVWSFLGAIALAWFQDRHVADDDRDPMIIDLPLWQIVICGPVAWLVRIAEELRS